MKAGPKLPNDAEPADDVLEHAYNSKILYDNYNYALVDAIVTKLTGRTVLDWVLELVAVPLRLEGMLRCMQPHQDPGIPALESQLGGRQGCYKNPDTVEQALSGRWDIWEGGPESTNW